MKAPGSAGGYLLTTATEFFMMFSLDFGVVNLGLTHYGLPSGKELNDLLGNEIARILKRKVAGIEQVQPCVGDVSQR